MSQNSLKQNPDFTKSNANIKVGKFYLLFEGSRSGHPGYIIWKNDEHNLYLAIKFGTSPNKNNKSMNCSLRKGDKENLVYNKLFLGKRKNIGKNELTEMSISDDKLKDLPDDVKALIKNMEITNNKEIESLKTDIKTLQEEKAQLKEDIKNLNKNQDKELTFQDYAKIFMEGLN